MDAYLSTRGAAPVPFAQALLRGLAPDGGLYVPAAPPELGVGDPPSGGTFADTARWAAARLLPGAMEPTVLERVVAEALDFPMPLVEVAKDIFVLELFHGPSLAFKDVGARFMARAMAAVAAPGPTHTVLVATSGDTGGAVASAFHGLAGYRVVVLFPRDGISERQRKQMTTLGGNVVAVSVDGTFDDCQRLAKGAFADPELREACALTSANSINIGRLLPQAFYYLHAASELGWSRAPATFVVPSGNLGNLCAGLLALRAGMPARGFVAATNRNRAFVDYMEHGTVAPRPSVRTISNAMDVGDPSNLERVRWLYGDDVARLRAHVRAHWVDDDATRECIRRVHAETGYVLDPHGAVGWQAMVHARGAGSGPWVVLATAHPWKFPEVVERVTGHGIAAPEGMHARLTGPERATPLPADGAALAALLLDSGRP
ncbi:MAG TPA: threonine synthase [Longimicrobiales bacterium]|nr:threonine synthase [Longimicrobiales bacterium]